MTAVMLLSAFWEAAARPVADSCQGVDEGQKQALVADIIDLLAYLQFCRLRVATYTTLLQQTLTVAVSSQEVICCCTSNLLPWTLLDQRHCPLSDDTHVLYLLRKTAYVHKYTCDTHDAIESIQHPVKFYGRIIPLTRCLMQHKCNRFVMLQAALALLSRLPCYADLVAPSSAADERPRWETDAVLATVLQFRLSTLIPCVPRLPQVSHAAPKGAGQACTRCYLMLAY